MKDAVSIRQRPAAVEDRAVPGHWEGDLLSGPNNTYIATLVERQTRYLMLAKVAGKDTRTVVTALIKQAKKLPKELYKSLTWDRGKELTAHRRFTLATNIDAARSHLLDIGLPGQAWASMSAFNKGRTVDIAGVRLQPIGWPR